MWYDYRAFLLRIRDVIAAWLMCIGMAACGLATEFASLVYEALLLE
jgi:hypothetical protein